jgi:hypothetical protein
MDVALAGEPLNGSGLQRPLGTARCDRIQMLGSTRGPRRSAALSLLCLELQPRCPTGRVELHGTTVGLLLEHQLRQQTERPRVRIRPALTVTPRAFCTS